jgi:hypothetical protein
MGKGKRKQRHNVAKASKEDWEYIDHIWAENGVVRARDKTGKVTTKTVKQAAQEAVQLNLMPVNDWHKKKHQAFIQKIIDVCREARAQLESGDKKTTELNNLISGLTPDGKPIPLTMETLMKMHDELSEEEIVAVMRNTALSDSQKMKYLNDEHVRRFTEKTIAAQNAANN